MNNFQLFKSVHRSHTNINFDQLPPEGIKIDHLIGGNEITKESILQFLSMRFNFLMISLCGL